MFRRLESQMPAKFAGMLPWTRRRDLSSPDFRPIQPDSRSQGGKRVWGTVEPNTSALPHYELLENKHRAPRKHVCQHSTSFMILAQVDHGEEKDAE